MSQELMRRLEQQARSLGQRVGDSEELARSLAASESECRAAVRGEGGSNCSPEVIARLAQHPFSLSRRFTDI